MTFQEFENIRQNLALKHKQLSRKTYLIAGGVILLIDFLINLQHFSLENFLLTLPQLVFFAFIVSIIIISLSTRKEAAEYKKAYKAYFVAGSLQKIFTDIEYQHDAGLLSSVYGQVMSTGDRCNSNDLVKAKYKNLNFTQADVHTERRYTDKDGDVHYATIFKGRFLIFDFDRNFTSNIVVCSKNFPGAILPKTTNKKFERIKTESVDFNKSFHFYAQDGLDALYVFDPAFMEKVQNLANECKKSILLTFMDKKVYIAINDGKDSFEAPSYRKPLDEQTELAKVEKDIRVITNFVDSLDLDCYCKKD